MQATQDFTWKRIAFELMKQYSRRTQGSYIENKGSALVWQYRDSDPEFGLWQAKELSQHLLEFMFGYQFHTLYRSIMMRMFLEEICVS